MEKKPKPGVSKGCCLEVSKYSRASKKDSFVAPGMLLFLLELVDFQEKNIEDLAGFVYAEAASCGALYPMSLFR